MNPIIPIVVDSAADFPKGMESRLSLNIVPIHIFIDKKSYLHGINISNRQIIAAMKKNMAVSTAPPFPGEYAKTYETLLARHERIISLHVSNDLSGCYQSAKNSLSVLPSRLAERVHLIDTRNFSIGQALIAKKATELLQSGLSPHDLENALTPYIGNCALFFTVDNLYWLKRAGKLNIFSSLLGGLLDLKPIIALKKGTLSAIKRYRGSDHSVEGLATVACQEYQANPAGTDIWVAHADAKLRAQRIRSILSRELNLGIEDIEIVDIGPTITAHAGPGSLCVALLPLV
jgi:DegV family protein with EDD domain